MIMIPEVLIMLDLWLSVTDLNNIKVCKKHISKELMPVAWHPTG